MPVTMFRSPSRLALLRSDLSRARSPRPRPRLGRRGPSRRPRVSRGSRPCGLGPRAALHAARARCGGAVVPGTTTRCFKVRWQYTWRCANRAAREFFERQRLVVDLVAEVLEQFYAIIWERCMVPFRATRDVSFLVDPQKI